MTALGRYCLAVCYCGTCPHHVPYELTTAERAQLINVLSHPPRKYTASWYRDPLGMSRFTSRPQGNP